MAKFEVREVFRLSSSAEFVLAGQIVEGTLRAGMSALVWLDGQAFWDLTVKGVDFVDRLSVGESLVGLRVAEQHETDADMCAELCPPGTVIEVREPA